MKYTYMVNLPTSFSKWIQSSVHMYHLNTRAYCNACMYIKWMYIYKQSHTTDSLNIIQLFMNWLLVVYYTYICTLLTNLLKFLCCKSYKCFKNLCIQQNTEMINNLATLTTTICTYISILNWDCICAKLVNTNLHAPT